MRAEGRIAELKATFDDAFETCDLIMSPVSCFPAFPNETFPGSITGDSSYPVQYWNGAFTMHANAIGHPAASVPAGFSPRWPAHRPPDHRPQVRRGDGAGRIGGLRAGAAVDPAPAGCVVTNGWSRRPVGGGIRWMRLPTPAPRRHQLRSQAVKEEYPLSPWLEEHGSVRRTPASPLGRSSLRGFG